MSETADTPVKTQASRAKIFVVLLLILFLLLVYGAGFFGLPISLLMTYQNKNCDSVVVLHKMYIGLYPDFIEDHTLSSLVQECDAYMLATSYEKKESWQQAYDAYQVYSTTYSNGIYLKEAHEQSAAVLVSIAKDQINQKMYEAAVTNLNLVLSNYEDTSISAEARSLLPSTYMSWGDDLRETRDFAKSEQVLNDLRIWSQSNQNTEMELNAQRELAQSYLAWGLDLQSQKQFEDALAKFDLAASADPHSQFDSTAQVNAGRSSTYIDWGNELLAHGQYSAAIEKFELAISTADGENNDARDALANGQIQWAQSLSAEEDFQSALEHLESAKEIAVSDTMKKSVGTALQDTYLAFSTSTGPQARLAMKEVLKTVCENQEGPELPIFGLNKDSVRFGIYGVDDQLPETLVAETPGEMHFVACVTTDNRTVESRIHKNIVLQFSRGYFYELVEQFRVQVIWNSSLLKTDTGESVAEQTLTGELPPPFSENGGNYFYGPTPIEELTLWLQSFIH